MRNRYIVFIPAYEPEEDHLRWSSTDLQSMIPQVAAQVTGPEAKGA